MPSNRNCLHWLRKVIKSTTPGSYLVEKYCQYRREKCETDRRKVTERELKHLNLKIDKLLTRLGDDDDAKANENLSDDECVVCLNANATMQTHPCGHKVTCRKCFIRTIQLAINQRSLPLKCVVCRARIIKVSEVEITRTGTNHVPLSHNAPGCLVTHRFFSAGQSRLDHGPPTQGIMGCKSVSSDLKNPPMESKDLTMTVTMHKKGTATYPPRSQQKHLSDFCPAAKLTMWRPFVKQMSI